MILMDGKTLRDELLEEYRVQIAGGKLAIRLDIITVGENEANEVYVRNKVKYASYVGCDVVTHHLNEDTSEEEIIALIEKLNTDESVTGIILQSPIPKGLNFKKCANRICAFKDIDGFTSENVSKLYAHEDGLMPCTVEGILTLLEHYKIDVMGKNVTVIGRSEIVGKPLAIAFLNENATVTVCHSKTEDLKTHTENADIVVSAVGQRNLITGEMVKDGFIGIDVGINRSEGKLCGDFDFDGVKDKASFLTPVPGGVGPMTVAMIINNLIKAKKMKR